MTKSSAPLLPPALFLIAGLILGDRMPASDLSFHACTILALCLTAAWAATHRRSTPVSLARLLQTGLLWVLVMGIGMLRAVQVNNSTVAADALLTIAADNEVFILGQVQLVRRPGSLILDARRLYIDDKATPIQAKIQVVLAKDQATPIAGQHLVLRGFLQQPAGPTNPGAFDYRTFLARQNIAHFFYANASYPLAVPAKQTWRRFIGALQRQLSTSLHRYIHDPAVRAVLSALLLGDTSALSATTREDFQQTGLMHLLAVSGLHVMLVGMVVYECLQPVCLRAGFSWQTMMRIRFGMTTFVLVVYLLVTGGKPPVVRAVLMAMLFMVGQQVQRQTSSLNLLSLAACVLLLYNPANVFMAGFQLSFSAVLGILLLLPRFKQLLPSLYQRGIICRYVADGVLVSLCASAGTLPVLLHHFGSVPLSGILLNLAALPLTAAALSAGICLLVVAPLSTSFATLLGHTVTWITGMLLTVVDKGAEFSFLLTPGALDFTWLLFLIVCLLLLPALLSLQYRWRAVLMIFACANILVWAANFSGVHRPTLTLTFFDVQHGDACLISFPNKKQMLVDTGGVIGDASVAERVLLPYLRFAGIDKLDAVLLSHPHQDHIAGLPTLMDAIPVHRVITAPDTSYARYLTAGRTVHHTVLAGDTLHLSNTTRLYVLAPDEKLNTDANPNTRSLFFQLRHGATRVLFTGDATTVNEQSVIQHFPAFLHGHIVKVPHHGSKTSSSRELVAALTGKDKRVNIAVISTGAKNRYDLPDDIVVNRWLNAGAAIHNTATDGALVVTSDGKTFESVAAFPP